MRVAFAHEALVAMGPDGDSGAPGAAITAELCGSWEHEPPCPLAPHHVSATRVMGGDVQLRTLFAATPDQEPEVLMRIERALTGGELVGPDGVTTRWQVRRSGPSRMHADEVDHATRLAGR